MAFTVQNDSGSVLSANAYVTVAEFKAFQDDRGGDYSSASDDQIEKAIVLATDFLDTRYSFSGQQRDVDQGTQFPRFLTGREFGSYEKTPLSGIPRALKHAACLMAMRSLGGATLLPDPTFSTAGQVTAVKKKVGPIETETKYSDALPVVQPETPKYPDVDLMLRNAGLLGPSGSKRIFRG